MNKLYGLFEILLEESRAIGVDMRIECSCSIEAKPTVLLRAKTTGEKEIAAEYEIQYLELATGKYDAVAIRGATRKMLAKLIRYIEENE